MAARKRQEVILISSDSESDDDDGRKQLEFFAAAAQYRIGIRMQVAKKLPFLVRNLRRSFLLTCREKGIPVKPVTTPEKPIQYTYRYRLRNHSDMLGGSSVWSEYEEDVTTWRCPVCNLLGVLNTEEMLRYHLVHDHSELDMKWTKNVSASLFLFFKLANGDTPSQ